MQQPMLDCRPIPDAIPYARRSVGHQTANRGPMTGGWSIRSSETKNDSAAHPTSRTLEATPAAEGDCALPMHTPPKTPLPSDPGVTQRHSRSTGRAPPPCEPNFGKLLSWAPGMGRAIAQAVGLADARQRSPPSPRSQPSPSHSRHSVCRAGRGRSPIDP